MPGSIAKERGDAKRSVASGGIPGFSESADMGEERVLMRSRFILRLLEQNFLRVDGPWFEEGKRVFYDVWGQDECRVRMTFDREFLSERDNDFARTTLETLREAKEMLRAKGLQTRRGSTTY